MTDWLIDIEEEEVGVSEAPTSVFRDAAHDIELPHLLVRDDGKWRDHAYCLGLTELTQIFFNPRLAEHAKELCAMCKVRKECFAFAKNNNLGHGVWGGIDFRHPKKGKKRVLPDDVD